MSNIKFIYQKKVHKVPPSVNNFQSLADTIKQAYKNLKQFYLFAIINPDFQDAAAAIDSDVAFLQLKQLYLQNGWPTIKLLVTENQDYKSVLKESWGLLNQSQVQVEKKQQDACTLVQPPQSDQSQQFAPQSGNQGIQAKVQQIDNSQNTQAFDFRNNEQLKNIIKDMIDFRLVELGLVGNKKQSDQSYTFNLTSRIPIFVAQPNKALKVQICLQNNGSKTWRKAYLINTELYVSQPLNDVAPKQCVQVQIEIPYNPKHFENQQETIYLFEIICYDENQKSITLDEKIPVKVKAPQNQNCEQYKAEMLKSLLELFPQKGEKFLKDFIQEKGQNKQQDELVEMLLQGF